jgi:hypothetical protein
MLYLGCSNLGYTEQASHSAASVLCPFRSFITARLRPAGPISGIVLRSPARKTSLKDPDASGLGERSRMTVTGLAMNLGD